MNLTIFKEETNTYKFEKITKFFKGIWLFPTILTIILIILSVLQINGSSMGIYYKAFYGDKTDPALIVGRPQQIRSDEWGVATQKTIAQKNNNFETVNKNMGNGENVALLTDAPTRNWSTIFKPHNIGFLFLPFNNAFALRWWMMSYLLILSCYFFVIMLLPKKILLASLLSLGFLLSPFFQWWYLYGTLGSVYYSLFGAVVFMKLLNSKKRICAVIWSILLTYIAVCFIMILYPPFQIPCALILITFAIGYFLEQRKLIEKKALKRNIVYFFVSIILSLLIVGLFIYQERGVITTMQNTSYPGQRIVLSGGYDIRHLLSSNLSPVFQSRSRASSYSLPLIGATNQSELSNFVLLLPFVIMPLMYLCIRKYKNLKQVDYIMLFLSFITVIFLAWMFIPGLNTIGTISLLDKVPQSRLLIGFGLLNMMYLVLFIRLYNEHKRSFSIFVSCTYTAAIFLLYLLLDFSVASKFPGFIDNKLAFALAIPIPIVIFCFMRKYFITGAILLLGFSVLSTFYINPLYRGTETITDTPISNAIRNVAGKSQKKWVSEDIILENFATTNGVPSITGTYLYPQLEIWRRFNQENKEVLYNRYAHVNFAFDRNPEELIKPVISSPAADQLNIRIEICDIFFKNNDVGFLITSVELPKGTANCSDLLKKISYPNMNFYIYKLAF